MIESVLPAIIAGVSAAAVGIIGSLLANDFRTFRTLACVLGGPRAIPAKRIEQPGYDVAALQAARRVCRGVDGRRRHQLDDAVAYVRRWQGPLDRPTTGWASLIPGALTVVRLAAEGRRNREIDASLFMSRGTVKTHLSHAYTKLGVTNPDRAGDCWPATVPLTSLTEGGYS